MACTHDGQFKVELEVWIRNLLVYSSAGSGCVCTAGFAHGPFGLGGPGWAEFLMPQVSPCTTLSGRGRSIWVKNREMPSRSAA